MARYPYSPALKPPGNWTSIDFADPRLTPAIQMLVQRIQTDISAYTPSKKILLQKQQVTIWDGETIDCFVLEPEGGCPKLPTMLYCHGGGFFLPIQPMMLELAAQYAVELGVRVYLPEYRILPEHPNPYPFRDCLSILEEIQKNSYSLQVAYDYFCSEFENLLQYVYGIKPEPDTVGNDATPEKELLRSALLSITYRIYFYDYLGALQNSRD